MKTYIFSIFLFISISSFAQKTSITIILKSGESFQTDKLSEKKNSFNFKDDEGTSQSIDISKIDKIISTGKKEKNNYTKRYIMYSKTKGDLMEEIVAGPVSLFKRTQFKMSGVGAMGAPMASQIIDYYVKRDSETVATYLQGENMAYGSYKKNVKDYFKDCEMLLAQIKEDNFKRRKIKEVIEFYNSNCSN